MCVSSERERSECLRMQRGARARRRCTKRIIPCGRRTRSLLNSARTKQPAYRRPLFPGSTEAVSLGGMMSLLNLSHSRDPAVVLLSGGLDSTTVLAHAIAEGYAAHALTFRYGQRHEHEIGAAQRIATSLGAAGHAVLDINLRGFGGSALTDSSIAVPKDRTADQLSHGIPVTYVPARNTIFLSFALAYAEVLGASNIFIGVNALDYSGYPDCRPEFIAAFETLANLATATGVEGRTRVRIRAPLQHMSKREIIEFGATLGVDYSGTVSCYDPGDDGAACGHCDACQLRSKGFREAGVADPTRYAAADEMGSP
jgi:7-cyano-7-deazaguanine synthase